MTGMWPRNIRDLNRVMSYVEEQMTKLLLGSYTGLDALEMERMTLHVGSVLLAAMNVSEMLKMSCFGFTNSSDQEITQMVNWPPATVVGGLGSVEPGKPVLTFMGDSFLSAWYAVKRLQDSGEADRVEVCGVGSVAHDIVRFYDRCRVLSPMATGRKVVRYGVSDVIVASTSCVDWDFLPDAMRSGTRVIWTGKERGLKLPDRTDDPVNSIVDDLVAGAPGAWVRDVEKAAEVAVKLLQKVSREPPRFFAEAEARSEARKCRDDCDLCANACPNGLLVGPALRRVSSEGLKALVDVEDGCYLCGRCEQVCPERIPLLDLMMAALAVKVPEDRLKMRAGRGPVLRVEVASGAFGGLFGNSPGVFHILGCGDARHRKELGRIANELVDRNALVFTAGCGAGEIGRHFNDKKGQYIYEQFGAKAQPRNLINCGACSACAHIVDAALKWSRTGTGASFYANYAETVDCQANITAPTLIVWGAMPDRVYALTAAWMRAGMPAVFGPNSAFAWKRHMLRSKWEWQDWWAYLVVGGRKKVIEPAPYAMAIPVETPEEALTVAESIAMRSTDIRDLRQMRLETYIEFHQGFYGDFPEDWHLFVRSDWEIPLRYKSRLLKLLKENYGWDIDRLRVKRARHPDGRLLEMGEFAEEYGAMATPVTMLPRLVARGSRSKKDREEVRTA
jgi:acetyl-CoA decarbonylase/synthase complex subunit alpha